MNSTGAGRSGGGTRTKSLPCSYFGRSSVVGGGFDRSICIAELSAFSFQLSDCRLTVCIMLALCFWRRDLGGSLSRARAAALAGLPAIPGRVSYPRCVHACQGRQSPVSHRQAESRSRCRLLYSFCNCGTRPRRQSGRPSALLVSGALVDRRNSSLASSLCLVS